MNHEPKDQDRFPRVTIIGTGQIGCAVAARLREYNMADEIIGVDQNPANLEMARAMGFIDLGLSDPARGVMGSSLVVLALPLDEVFKVLEAAGPDLRPNAVVTCTAGTTNRIRQQVLNVVPQASHFVPSFPLVFSKNVGPGGASAALLSNQTCLVSMSEQTPQPAVEGVRNFWKNIGLGVQVLDAERFEWSIVGVHYWPALMANLMNKVARRGNWPLGGSVLGQWLELCSTNVDWSRCYQLHAQRLSALLEELGQETVREQQKLGSLPTHTPVPERRLGKRQKPIITIDGPAGSGKTTVARKVAELLQFTLVDTGALYRGLALSARNCGIHQDDAESLAKLAELLTFQFEERGLGKRVWLGEQEVTEAIREPDISQMASRISALPAVRASLLGLQREMGKDGGVVLEGRDTGTVVFPDAEVKIFLEAPMEARAQRRHEELKAKGTEVSLEQTLDEVRERDRRDQRRSVAPLKPAGDAVIIDTGSMSVEQVVAKIQEVVLEKAGAWPKL